MSAPSLSLLKEKIRKKKKLGFTEKASAVARGLLPRKSGKFKGKKVKSKKYGGRA
tara:strand:- start:214 stop:378 length:165 start_codon:yes stop_codon:yes gene_type:complete